MRKILFRAKRLDNGEWVEGFYVCLNGTEHMIYSGYAETDCGEFYPDYFQVDPETVCQYTGLKDKNYMKIFENDVVRDCNEDYEVVAVKYYDHIGYAAFDVEPDIDCDCNGLSYLIELQSLEVIGNIFDNPELMKGGEK